MSTPHPDLDEALPLLQRTPAVLDAWMRDLPEAWTHADEGPGSWRAVDIVAHLVHCELEDWLPRARILLEHGEGRPFDPFDPAAGVREHGGRGVNELLDEFARLRAAGLEELRALDLTDLDRTGTHPAFGTVTLGQLLATWTVHDQTHLRQIARVMAKRWSREVGPWSAFLPVMREGPRA